MGATGTPRTALVFSVLLLAVVVISLALAPRLVDVRGLAPQVSANLSQIIGREVRVGGDVLLSFLPRPQLILRDIATPPDPSGGFALSVEEARADLAWSALLLGEYDITAVQLMRPDIDLRLDGWPKFDQQLPRIILDHARVTVRAVDRDVLVEALDAEIDPSAQSAFSWKVSGTLEGVPLNTEGRLGPSRTTARKVSATIRFPEADVTVDFDGNVSSENQSVAGRVAISALRAGDIVALSGAEGLSSPRWPWTAQATTISADVSFNSGSLGFASGAASVGAQTSEWSGRIQGQSFDFKIEPTAIDFATWLPRRDSQSERVATDPSRSVLSLLLPGAWQGTVSIDGARLAPSQPWLRDSLVQLNLSAGSWTLREARLSLPGQTRLSLSGQWNDTSDMLGFDGAWRVDVQDAPQLLSWLGFDQNASQGALSGFTSSGLVQTDERLLVLNDIAMAFDGTSATGRLSYGWDATVPFNIDLDVDRLAVDAYAPLVRVVFGNLLNVSKSSDAASGYGVNPLVPWLSQLLTTRGSVRMAVNQASWRDVVSGSLGIDVAVADGVIDIRSMAFNDTSGASVWVGGKLRNLDGVPSAEGLQFDFKAADVARFLRAARADVAAPLRNLAPWSATGALNGSLLDATVSLDAKFGAVSLTARGKSSLAERDVKVNTQIDVAHPNLNQLRDTLWPGAKFATRPDGALATSTALNISGSRWSLENTALVLGPYRANGRISIDARDSDLAINAALTDINIDTRALWPTTLVPLVPPGDWNGEITLSGSQFATVLFDAQDFSARFLGTPHRLELTEWAGKLFGGAATISGAWTVEPDSQLHRMQGKVDVTDADAARITELLPATSKAKANISLSVDATALRAANWTQGLAGDGSITLTVPPDTMVRPFGVLAPLAAVNQAESSTGRVAAKQDLRAVFSLERGVATFSELTIQSNAYGGALRGSADFAGQSLDLTGTLRLRDRGVIAGPSARLVLPPSVPITISGPLAAPSIKLDLTQR